MKEKFTKPDWVVADGTKMGEQILFVHSPEFDGVICRLTRIVNHEAPLSEVDIANAHLIATAPKMYEMLKDILDNYECGEIIDRKIGQLLAEARGEL